jgi:hypothetical protein
MTGGMVHVSQDLSSANSNTIGTGENGLGDMTTKLETGRHVGEKTSLMGEVDQFEGILKAKLEYLSVSLYHMTIGVAYNTFRRIGISSPIESDLVKSTKSSKFNTPSTNLDIIGNNRIVTLGIGFGKIINKWSIQVESSRKDLFVIPKDMSG